MFKGYLNGIPENSPLCCYHVLIYYNAQRKLAHVLNNSCIYWVRGSFRPDALPIEMAEIQKTAQTGALSIKFESWI